MDAYNFIWPRVLSLDRIFFNKVTEFNADTGYSRTTYLIFHKTFVSGSYSLFVSDPSYIRLLVFVISFDNLGDNPNPGAVEAHQTGTTGHLLPFCWITKNCYWLQCFSIEFDAILKVFKHCFAINMVKIPPIWKKIERWLFHVYRSYFVQLAQVMYCLYKVLIYVLQFPVNKLVW